jgi:hypothetical protein
MSTEKVFFICLASFLSSLVAILAAATMYDSYKAAEMVKNGADPIAVKCLLGDSYGNTPVCILYESNRRQGGVVPTP